MSDHTQNSPYKLIIAHTKKAKPYLQTRPSVTFSSNGITHVHTTYHTKKYSYFTERYTANSDRSHRAHHVMIMPTSLHATSNDHSYLQLCNTHTHTHTLSLSTYHIQRHAFRSLQLPCFHSWLHGHTMN